VTTSRDPEGRPTIYDAIGEAARGLVPVGRLDLATSGLLLLTRDTKLADWMTVPLNKVALVYVVTVRGKVMPEECLRLEGGLSDGRDLLKAESAQLRKVSARESHLTVELREGKNREVGIGLWRPANGAT
jgi:23S rRNA pseudouridine2605 synthase